MNRRLFFTVLTILATLLLGVALHAVRRRQRRQPRGERPHPGRRAALVRREQLVAQLVGRLRQNRFLAVMGASGSGKSSVVQAGLVPALKRGADIPLADGTFPPAGSPHWPLHVITLTNHPLAAD